mgnify:CR=1 FL=1
MLIAGTVVQASDWDNFLVQIVSASGTPAVTMAAFGAFRKDGNNTTIATHEDPNVTAVPGGYNNGDTMNSNHEFDYDYDVNGTDRTFTLVLGAQPPTNVVFDFTIGAWVGDHDHAAANTSLGTDLVVKDSGGNTVTQATFTNGNWNTAQTFTVVPVQDNVIEGYENGAIIAAVEARMRPGALSGSGFLGPKEKLAEVIRRDACALQSIGVSRFALAEKIDRVNFDSPNIWEDYEVLQIEFLGEKSLRPQEP